jgi:lysophospholipase L1-like esterase
VDDHHDAQSGESIKSSLNARRFEKIFNLMKPGNWLLVQFGHNDMKDRVPDALATYRANLKSILARTRAKGGTPVLITSMAAYSPTSVSRTSSLGGITGEIASASTTSTTNPTPDTWMSIGFATNTPGLAPRLNEPNDA